MTAGSQGFAEGGLGLWEGQRQDEARRPRPDPVCSYQCGLSQVCLQGLSETMQSKQTKVKLKGGGNQVRQNRAIRLQSARLPSMHRVQWEHPLAHCQGLLLTAGLSSTRIVGQCSGAGALCFPPPAQSDMASDQGRPWPAHLQARQLQKPGPFGSGPFPRQAWSQGMQTLQEGPWGPPGSNPYVNITWGPSTLTLSHSACPAHPTAQPRTPHPFIPPLPTPDPPKPALSPLPGKPVPFPPSPHRSQPGSCHFLPPSLPSSTPAPTI